MENDDDSGGKDHAPSERKFDDTVRPVSPDESGEGLPYAPVDWPNPGDNWVWRVGHRLSVKGTFRDRYLSIPRRLQKRPTKALEFQSKPAVVRYLRSEFPKADISAFFASFTWVIPAKPEFMQQGQYVYCPPLKRSLVKKLEKNRGGGVFKRKRQAVLTEKDEISSGNGCTNQSMDSAPHGEETLAASSKGLASTSSPRRQLPDDSNVSQDHAPLERKFDDTVRPVSPDESGEGLPYAPVDWPNPGDNWVWRVGHRLWKKGTFRDRYLRIPRRLQKRPSSVLEFQSKPAVERYLRSEFPKADISAFFASFTWVIRAKPEFMQQGQYVHCPHGEETLAASSKGLASTSSPQRQLPDDSNVSQDDSPDFLIDSKVQINKEFEGDPSPEEFDNYLKSLDEIFLDAPLPMHKEEAMTDIRKKLSSLLAMGTGCLLSSDHVNELIALTYKLQNDPSLEAKELSMLKLIQSVPFTSKSFLEAKELSSKADKFFDGLDAKITSVALLKEEYNAIKDEMEVIQAGEASTLLDIIDIDQEISNLEKQRQAKAEMIKANSKKLLHLTSIQTSVMKSLPKLVHEVQIENSEKSIWELKKKKAAEEEVEILARFAPLEGFSF